MEIEMSDQDLCQCSILMLTNLRNLIHWEKSNHEQICIRARIKEEVKSFLFQPFDPPNLQGGHISFVTINGSSVH